MDIKIKICSSFSNKFRISSGVLQGSQLGPVIFLLFINDLPEVVNHSVCLLFTDDCRLLESDLTAVSVCCKSNNLTLNVQKGRSMTFCRSSVKCSYQYNIDLVEPSKIDCKRILESYLIQS